MKEEKTKSGGSYDGHTTLRRNAMAKHSNSSSGPVSELQKIRRQNVDSGYSTSDGYDKRWSQELNGATTVTDNGNTTKWSPTLGNDKHSPIAVNTPPSIGTPKLSPVNSNNNNSIQSNEIEGYTRPSVTIDSSTPKRSTSNGSNNNRYVLSEFPINFLLSLHFAHLSYACTLPLQSTICNIILTFL